MIAALKKYRRSVKSVKSGPHEPVHPSHCALDSMVDEFPRPLPVDRNALLRDSLIDWGLPLPFCVGLMYDPEHLRRKEEERVAEEKRLEEERLRLAGLERIRKIILAEERNELQQREILQRAAFALVEPEAWAVLPIMYLEFMEIVALQRFKEQQDRIDLESDQQFFREMQRKQLLSSAGVMSSGQLIAQSIQEKWAKQLHKRAVPDGCGCAPVDTLCIGGFHLPKLLLPLAGVGIQFPGAGKHDKAGEWRFRTCAPVTTRIQRDRAQGAHGH
jgi:hypothetical protein